MGGARRERGASDLMGRGGFRKKRSESNRAKTIGAAHEHVAARQRNTGKLAAMHGRSCPVQNSGLDRGFD